MTPATVTPDVAAMTMDTIGMSHNAVIWPSSLLRLDILQRVSHLNRSCSNHVGDLHDKSHVKAYCGGEKCVNPPEYPGEDGHAVAPGRHTDQD